MRSVVTLEPAALVQADLARRAKVPALAKITLD
jgi:hypothetical protein